MYTDSKFCSFHITRHSVFYNVALKIGLFYILKRGSKKGGSIWAFPLIEAGRLSAHTAQALAAGPVSAPILNAKKENVVIFPPQAKRGATSAA